jgi:hypothetical protein
MLVAYFVRGGGANWAVIKLYPDNREEIVADGLSLIEAEILCAMKIEDIPRPMSSAVGEFTVDTTREKKRGPARQLALKF